MAHSRTVLYSIVSYLSLQSFEDFFPKSVMKLFFLHINLEVITHFQAVFVLFKPFKGNNIHSPCYSIGPLPSY